MKTLILTLCLLTTTLTFASQTYCDILNPRAADEARASCPGQQYGITYQGHLISKDCFNTFEEAVKAMKNNKSCQLNGEVGSCKILLKGMFDKAQTFCAKGTFGVTFKGHVKSKTTCYPSLEKALQEMHQMPACLQKTAHKDFAILPPRTYDESLQFCPTYQFGVTYKGVLINKTCYDSVEKALEVMAGVIKKFEN